MTNVDICRPVILTVGRLELSRKRVYILTGSRFALNNFVLVSAHDGTDLT